jgi:hypothetical protein
MAELERPHEGLESETDYTKSEVAEVFDSTDAEQARAVADESPIEEIPGAKNEPAPCETETYVEALVGAARPKPSTTALQDDWFDRALAGLDEPTPPVPTPSFENLHPELARHREDRSEPMELAYSHVEEQTPAAEAPVAHEIPAATPHHPEAPVIGRYESGGTSYVMFADGSIEASTENGVFRFASMAELKSFIENRS